MGRIESVTVKWVELPLKEVFATSKGRRKRLQSAIYELFTSDRIRVMGESPTSKTYPLETKEEMKRVANSLIRMVLGREVTDYEEIVRAMRKAFPYHPMTISGLEQAIFRAYLATIGTDEFSFWGAKRRRIETDITLPNILSERRLKSWVGSFVDKGFRVFKLKLSGILERDKIYINYVEEILEQKGIPYSLRLDMNEGYSLHELISLLLWLSEKSLPIEFVEQPLPKEQEKELKELTKESPYPLVLDESIRRAQDVERLVDLGIKFGVNMKIAKSGILETKKIHDLAQKLGMRIMMGCMVESFVGLSSSILFAMGHGDFDYIDLDSIHYLEDQTPSFGIEVSGPYYTFGGLDFSPDPM